MSMRDPDDLSAFNRLVYELDKRWDCSYSEEREFAADVLPPDEVLTVHAVVARSRGPFGGISTGVSDERAIGADETVANEDKYGVHIREDPDPSLEVGTGTDIRTDVEWAINQSDYEYADFGPENCATATIHRWGIREAWGDYEVERVVDIDIHLDEAVHE